MKERENYNRVITIKLVIPSACNYNCRFCYNHNNPIRASKQEFLTNFITSLNCVLDRINGYNECSLDITGGEPTIDEDLFMETMQLLKESGIKKKLLRCTLTTNGVNLQSCIPHMAGVVDYVNISTHDFRQRERSKIFMGKVLSDEELKDCVVTLNHFGIPVSTCAVIFQPINDFDVFLEKYVRWCQSIGFIALRLRCDVFWVSDCFDRYMAASIQDKRYTVIDHENTPDSHWCRLRRFDKFRVFFLHGVPDTSKKVKGIEYVIHDDGLPYLDFYKNARLDEADYTIGKIFDL